MRTTFFSLLAICVGMVNAQEVTVSKAVPLMKGTESAMYNPVLSEDGNNLLFSNENYKGLYIYNFQNNVVTKVSDAERAGLYPTISADGKVYYITQEMRDNRNYRNLMSYDTDSQKSVELISNQRNITAPKAVTGGVIANTASGLKNIGGKKALYVYTEGSTIVIGDGNKEKSFSPVESYAGYLWASLSPNNDKVMFVAAGKGIVIMTLDGKVLNKLGNYVNPVWYGNDYVIAQKSTDDGHQFSSSKLVLLKADGTFVKDLTSATSMAMNPATSFATQKVVYNTIDGRLYMMNLSIK